MNLRIFLRESRIGDIIVGLLALGLLSDLAYFLRQLGYLSVPRQTLESLAQILDETAFYQPSLEPESILQVAVRCIVMAVVIWQLLRWRHPAAANAGSTTPPA